MSKVFKFTYTQAFKGGATKTFLIMLCIAALISMPLCSILQKQEIGKNPVKTLIVWDETGMGFSDFSVIKENEDFKNTEIKTGNDENQIGKDDLMIHLTKSDEGIFHMSMIAKADGNLSEISVMEKSRDYLDAFAKLRYKSQNLSDEEIKMATQEVSSSFELLKADGTIEKDEKGEGIGEDKYSISLAILILMVFFISFSAEAVSTSVVTEKSNKLVETLILCIDTKKLISGKILGSLAVVATQLIAGLVCLFISAVLNMLMFGLDKLELPEQVETLLSVTTFPGLTPFNVVLALISFLLGVVFFSVLAGLFGATISRIEEMGEGMKVYNLILLLGAYSAIGIRMFSLGETGSMAEKVIGFIPFSAPFILPTNVLMGLSSTVYSIIAVVVQAAFTIVLFYLVARVYKTMIMYKGSRLTLKELLPLIFKKEVRE